MLKAVLAALGLIGATTAEAQITPRPEVLAGAFEPGFVGEDGDRRYALRTLRLGQARIPSGQVIVADPFLISTDNKPLASRVPPGVYPVDLAVADAGENGQRVALARLLISDVVPTRWAMGVVDGEDASTLTGDAIFGFGVDTGTAAFIDASVPRWLEANHPSSDLDVYEDLIDGWQVRGEAAAASLGMPHGFALIEPLGDGDAAMFSPGWGDGTYASWVGYDDQDRPVSIVIDFAVISVVNIPPAARSR